MSSKLGSFESREHSETAVEIEVVYEAAASGVLRFSRFWLENDCFLISKWMGWSFANIVLL